MDIRWDVSACCNLHCKHCGEWHLIENARQLDKKDIILIAENLSKIATRITLLGGEPFLAPGLENACRILEASNIPVDLITNGQICADSVRQILSMKNVEQILVSIDGVEEDNDEVRGNGTWSRAIRFLDEVLVQKSARQSVGISTVLTKKSVCHIDDFLEYFNSKKIDMISFNLLDITGNAASYRNELELDNQSILDFLEHICAYLNKATYKIGINSGSPNVNKYLHYRYGYPYTRLEKRCDALFGSGLCDINGYFYPCRRFKGAGIDLKNKIDWNKEYKKFDEFLQKTLCHEDVVNSVCEKMWCPIIGFEGENELDLLAKERMSFLPVPNYKISGQAIFQEMDTTEHRFFIIFCKTNEFVELTKDGFAIYKMLESGLATLEIAKQIECSVDVLRKFLEEECQKGRIAICTV